VDKGGHKGEVRADGKTLTKNPEGHARQKAFRAYDPRESSKKARTSRTKQKRGGERK